MISRLKIFWDDLPRLSRWRFFCKYFLPLLSLFFLWGVIGDLSLLTLKTKSLIAHKGQVFDIGVRLERGYKGHKYYPLKMVLLNQSMPIKTKLKRTSDLFRTFRLKDNFAWQFPYIENAIHPGDTITVYTRKKWQVLVGMGQQDDIYQIEKNVQILFPIEDMIEYQRSQTVVFAIFALIFTGGYSIYLRIRFLEKRRPQPT